MKRHMLNTGSAASHDGFSGLTAADCGRSRQPTRADDLISCLTLRRARYVDRTVILLLSLIVLSLLADLSLARAQSVDEFKVISRDPAGHGMLAQCRGKTVLWVEGTPEQMGRAQGTLLNRQVQRLCERTVYLVGAADSLNSGRWFFDRMEEIDRRTSPYIPERFQSECQALAEAAGISQRDAWYANLFPERFHCSGIAVRGKATVDGQVIHARVLDYMRDIHLQECAVVQVFMPHGRHAWISHGYAGFVGTVTAMNECGVAIGEMGGRGEGDWDGMPMSLLMRDIMERADSVDEALQIIRETPRTCEYYYVISDQSGAMAALECTPGKVTVLRPGEQHPRLPKIPEEAVLISEGDRAAELGRRLHTNYGKIDAAVMVEMIKRPVAMRSNLHNAIFAPGSLELWLSDAGLHTPACDEPYAHFTLPDLLTYYREHGEARQ